MNKQRWVVLLPLTLMFCIVLNLSADKVCSFRFTNVPEEIPATGLSVPDDAVAMAKFIKTKDSSDINGLLGVTSLMFVIDNSGSNGQSDTKGSRWSVPNALIDTLYKINPNVEIGAAVFGSDLYFDPRDESLFKKCSMGSYGYLPMLKLNETYTSSELGTKTGYEILKFYMKHAGYHLEYALKKEALKLHTGTNITVGFRAAKDAMKDALYPKENQFVFFFSDGVASTGGNEYLTGADVPTTFTIFLAPGISWPIPDEIDEMMTNIESNGYSKSNKKSAVWKMMSGHKQIMKLVVDHVIPNMITMVKMIPSQIKVQGKLNDLWDGTGFTYDSLFPLTGTSTAFNYEITYDRTKDSITNDGDTFNIDMGDTIHSIIYDADLTNGTVSDLVETRYWGRSLEFYHKGSKISAIDATMDEFEIRFTPYTVDTNYDYSDVTITLSTDNSTSDSESLLLKDMGTFFSVSVPRTLGAVIKGDGILQHEVSGTLSAHFKNKDLVLDTLQISIPFATPGDCIIKESYYYDRDADGFVDSITVSVDGGDLSKDLTTIVSALELPSFRNFSIQKSSYSGSQIALLVEEKRTSFQTYVSDKDSLRVNSDEELPSGYTLLSCAVSLQDRVAPVVMKALVVDSVKNGAQDFITVTFSEDVKNSFASIPFQLYEKTSNDPYEVTLSVDTYNNNEATFKILDITGTTTITHGDSLHIHWNNDPIVSDLVSSGNSQSNQRNRKCAIDVITIEEDIKLHNASYFDTDANGLIDSIFIGMSGKDIALYSDTIVASLQLPDFRKLSISKHQVTSKGLALEVKQNITEKDINTATVDEDIIALPSEIELPNGNKVLTCDLEIEDRMAPVIMSATLLDSMDLSSSDELRLTFSENIEKITEEKGFRFYEMPDNKEYFIGLRDCQVTDNFCRFTVIDKNIIAKGDSICINYSPESVTDLKNNTQKNRKNIRRPIDVIIAKNEILLTDAIFFDRNANGRIDEVTLLFSGEKVKENIDTIVSLIGLPKKRRLSVIDANWQKNAIRLHVKQDISEKDIHTGVYSSDTVTITDTVEISDKTRLLSATVSALDSMAPVIMEASIVDSVYLVQKGSKETIDTTTGEDRLTVIFSEPVEDPEELYPFIMYDDDMDESTPELTLLSNSKMEAQFIIQSKSFATKVESGDSIHINWELSDNIMDTLLLNQNNRDNIKRPIAIERVETITYEPASISWELKASILNLNADDEDSLMYIVLEPRNPEEFSSRDRLEARVTLIDKVGNIIFTDQEMEESEKKPYQYIYCWDGSNYNKRKVGAKTFVAQVRAKRYFEKESGETELQQPLFFKTLVGVEE